MRLIDANGGYRYRVSNLTSSGYALGISRAINIVKKGGAE